MAKKILITNDDGVGCLFLHELALAMTGPHRVFVAAPSGERSWIGRAFSRNGEVTAKETTVPGAERAWSISGTPADCVNIALGHLTTRELTPDIVISGINIGYNVSMPLGLSSGTMAGAIEGAAWGLRAAAFSLHLNQEDFEHLRHHDGRAEGATLAALRHAARHARRFVDEMLETEPPRGGLVIENVNFPRDCHESTPVERVSPAHLRLGSLFAQTRPDTFGFAWNDGVDHSGHDSTDLAALARGHISKTTLDFSKLGG